MCQIYHLLYITTTTTIAQIPRIEIAGANNNRPVVSLSRKRNPDALQKLTLEEEVNNCPQSAALTRRQFSFHAIYGLGALIGLGVVAPATVYVFGSPSSKRETGWIDAGSVTSVPNDSPVELPVVRIHRDGWKIVTEQDSVWVVKSAGTLTAFSPRCTHLGCAYHWDPAKKMFACPCHGSLFSITGEVVSGPAPRALDRFVTRIDGDRLWVGKLENSDGERQS
jgi:menaquinol-cytochrome c reductase iron-sulfur subunit